MEFLAALDAREVRSLGLVGEGCATGFFQCFGQVRVLRLTTLAVLVEIGHALEDGIVVVAAITNELVLFETPDGICMCAIPPDMFGVGMTSTKGT